MMLLRLLATAPRQTARVLPLAFAARPSQLRLCPSAARSSSRSPPDTSPRSAPSVSSSKKENAAVRKARKEAAKAQARLDKAAIRTQRKLDKQARMDLTVRFFQEGKFPGEIRHLLGRDEPFALATVRGYLVQRAAEDAKLRQILNDNWTRFIFEEDPSGFLGPSNNIDEAISFLTRGSSMETTSSARYSKWAASGRTP